jgi:hypothetical protein
MSRVDDQAAVVLAEVEVVAAAVRLAEWVRLNHPYAVRPEEQAVIDAVDKLEDAMREAMGVEKKGKKKGTSPGRAMPRKAAGVESKEICDDME